MKLSIPKSSIKDIDQFIRRAGYGMLFDKRTRSIKSYTKRLHGDMYPRYHVYVEEQEDSWTINLHLDQRATVYEGVTAHAGEYDGEIVEREILRIESFLKK
jgi:hypothetical protein